MPIGIGDQQRGFTSSIRIATGSRLVVKATVEGDIENGLLLMGQGAGRIHDIPTVAELIERSVREAEQILKTLNTRIGS
jgi:NAD(P)H-dependent flavin oxidoreductase YrpB (nitropropane dioxygenase family)